MHGVFMDILGLGVMITGESGLGKSELGLEFVFSPGQSVRLPTTRARTNSYRVNQAAIRRQRQMP
jgi:HPr kinase/phosphorylase